MDSWFIILFLKCLALSNWKHNSSIAMSTPSNALWFLNIISHQKEMATLGSGNVQDKFGTSCCARKLGRNVGTCLKGFSLVLHWIISPPKKKKRLLFFETIKCMKICDFAFILIFDHLWIFLRYQLITTIVDKYLGKKIQVYPVFPVWVI